MEIEKASAPNYTHSGGLFTLAEHPSLAFNTRWHVSPKSLVTLDEAVNVLPEKDENNLGRGIMHEKRGFPACPHLFFDSKSDFKSAALPSVVISAGTDLILATETWSKNKCGQAGKMQG